MALTMVALTVDEMAVWTADGKVHSLVASMALAMVVR
jgi:hypothetical protein